MEESRKDKKDKKVEKREEIKVEKKTLNELTPQAQALYRTLQQQKLTATEVLTKTPEHKDKDVLLEIKNNLE